MNALPFPHRTPRAVALVVVLAFVVLLTGLVVAYFSRSMTGRQLSNNSAGQMRATLLAQTATDTIVAGFKQEIKNGSTSSPIPNATPANLYVPTTNASAVPVHYPKPSPSQANPIPNLVRESVHDDSGNSPVPAPAVPSYASALNSTTTAATDGRSVSLARWNSHFLIPSQSTAAVADSTPDTTVNFTAPDWVIVTRNGPSVQTAVSSGAGALNDATSTNGNYVIGRYAYAVYDEGGLLDMNVAGHPTPATTAAQTGFTPTQVARKSSLAIADLTQLPLVKNPNSASDYLGQIVVDQIVGWRNFASAGLDPSSSTYPNFTINPTQAANWYTNFASKNTSGFLKVYSGPASYTGPTDQAFTSRQQLLRMRSSMGFSANVLQYLGTFSRALDQPSFQPDSNRPAINPTSVPPSSPSSYQGNNSYAGGDAAINFVGVPGGLLSVRVTDSFPRLDGSTAVVGEPLVKRRFALSRLSLVTSTATASQNTGDPIYDRFGLFRSDTSSPWVYNHGASNIMTLTQVAAQKREPDMAELLKAAINVGSVGKATFTNQGGDLEYTYDISGDRQILQIMANLIDQTKLDNYPTQIKPFSGDPSTLAVYGVQNLPYFYNWHFYNLTTRVPTPNLTKNDTVSGTDLGSTDGGNHMRLVTPTASLSDPGAASCMIIPEIWNPHDANTLPAPNGGPNQFRVVAETTDPTGTLGYWQIQARPSTTGGWFDGYGTIKPPDSAKSAYVEMRAPTSADSSDSALSFTDNSGGTAFREPTLLWRDGLPNGVRLAGTSRTEDSSLTGKTYYGILVGDTAVSWLSTINNKQYICQTSTLCKGDPNPGVSGGIPNNLTFRMQYKNPSGQWITYQNVLVEASLPNYPSYGVFVNSAEPDYTTNQQYWNPTQTTVNGGDGTPLTPSRGGPYDPRTARFASPVLGFWDKDDPSMNGDPTLDAVTMIGNTNNGRNNGAVFSYQQNKAVADSNFVLMATQRPATSRGQFFYWTNPGYQGTAANMRWYSSADPNGGGFFGGMLSQNDPAVQLLTQENATTPAQIYYEDADRVCRRAMGAYAKSGTNPVSGDRTTSTNSPIGLPLVTASKSFTNPDLTSKGYGTPTTQSQSRPIILHRPFTNVAEMGVAFRGTPWKNIDFFTPESGDTALLDVFCVDEPPADAIVAGKVNLNTQQTPVLQAILAGAYRDELTTNKLPVLSNTEAANVASVLADITSNPTNKTWRGPLNNIADLVGHFVNNAGTVSGSDVYQYTSNGGGTAYTYAGLSAALGGKTPSGDNIWDNGSANGASINDSTLAIQRIRETAIRPLASCGQTRVWNLMIDVIAQSGRYPQNSTTLSQFSVDGETRCWVHVAIDRFTGQVIDKQMELVTE